MTTILIVEDDAFIRELAEMTIQDWGYDTVSAGDIDEALLLLRSDQPIQALFTDICLDTELLGGCDLARQAVKIRPGIQVLYATGNYVSDLIKDQLIAGAECLRKPYSPHQLEASLQSMFPGMAQ